MIYNISFDIAAILMLLVLIGGMNTVLYTDTYGFRLVRKYVYFVLLGTFLDIVTAVTISYGPYIPDGLNQILNTAYQFASAFSVISAMHIVFNYYPKIDKVNTVINRILQAILVIYLAINLFTGIAFRFENGKYVHGPIFVATYIFSLAIIVHAIVVVIIYRNERPRSISLTVIMSLLMPVIFAVTQMLVGDVLISSFGAALAAFVMMFALETPDYRNLMKTMSELELAKEEANIANSAKSDFLASMSHEIRTPLNGILGMDTMILRDCNDPQIKEYAENIRIAGDGLLSIINDILDLSKIESGRMELQPADYDLFSVLNECCQMNRMRASEGGLKLLVETDPDMPSEYFGDQVRIRQILNNLISNGIKYTKEGYVKVKASYSDGDLVLAVQDSGIGIKEEDIGRLFENFTRLEENKNRNIEGTGLGLPITDRLVKLMNGSIDVESEYGKGSVFTVRIPQNAVSEKKIGSFEERVKENISDTSGSKDQLEVLDCKVLIIDDVKMNILVFRGLLRGSGVDIDFALSGQEGIDKTRETKYDMIFMDHLMPQMDGIEAFRRIREDADNINRDTPVIVLTANALVGAKGKYLEEGFADYLSKPVEQSSLLRMISKYSH
ncbi:MAG: response regulator [Lachnospiraceae bacterium]|nr:response regulator [Lachnospiraceae bacterium]